VIANIAVAAGLFVAGLRLFVAPKSWANAAFAAALLFLVAVLMFGPGGSL
jgi:hypothetical protein